ncbi:MAG: transporter substrate-binding domain-containing protein, partial [Pseudomonadota bacterium]
MKNLVIILFLFNLQILLSIQAKALEKIATELPTEHHLKIKLSASEKDYLIRHPVIKVSNEMDWPPFDFAVSGNAQGYSIDLLNLLAKRIGLKIEYINGYTWSELEDLFKKGELDLIHSLSKTPEREKFGLFSTSFRRIQTYFITRTENPEITGITELYGKTVAVSKGWATQEFLIRNHPQITLYETDNIEQTLDAVSRGDAYASINNNLTSLYTIKRKMISNLKVSNWFKDYDRGKSRMLHFLAHKKDPQLISLLNKAYAFLTPKDMVELDEKWFGVSFSDQLVNFTDKERKYLQQKQSIKFCADPDWMPFEKIENGVHIGLASDYMKIISKQINTPIILEETKSWTEALEKVKNRQCDILSMAAQTSNREKYLDFTSPYIETPIVIATKPGLTFIEKLESIQEKKLAVVKNYSLHENLKKLYPNINLVNVDSIHDGLKKVEKNEVFGYLDNSIVLNHEIQKNYLGSINISGRFSSQLQLSIATRNDEKILHDIFEKAILSISTQTRQQILNKWVKVNYATKTDYALLWQLLTVFIFIILAFSYWNRKLHKEIKKRKSIQQELKVSEEKFRTIFDLSPVMIDGFDKMGRCVLWNKECEKVFGWTIDEINEHKNAIALFYPDPKIQKDALISIQEKPDNVFKEWHPITKNGKILTTLWANVALPNNQIISIGYDITQQR